MCHHDEWLRVHPPTVEWFSGQFSAAEVAPDSLIATTVSDAHELVTGQQSMIEGVTYGADMRHFVEAGIPCVMYGAGDVRLAHHADEFVPVGDLLTVATTLCAVLLDWCGGGQQSA